MRDSYVGDIGDFAKYGLLRTLARGRRLGVAWYMPTDSEPARSNDGRHTDYLDRPAEWRRLDPELFDGLGKLVRDGRRTVAAVQRSGLLGNAAFADEPLDVSRIPSRDRERWRREWFERIRARLADCDLVFADPDNGLYPDDGFRYGRKESSKRIPPSEALALADGRPAVIYHHNTRAKGGHFREIEAWMDRLPAGTLAYYWRRWSPRTFFVVNPDAITERRLGTFAALWGRNGKTVPAAPGDGQRGRSDGEIRGRPAMNGRKEDRQSMKPQGAASVRASISFPPDIYEVLEQFAREKKVSLAWVVRNAVERYITEQGSQSERE